MNIVKSVMLFAVAAVFEIGGAWLVWQGIREHRGWLWAGAGVIALGAYGFVATLQPDANSVASWRHTAGCSLQDPCCGRWWPTAFGPIAGTSPGPRSR